VKLNKQRQEKLVAQWIRPEIRALSAYHVPSAAGFVKLDAMENPYSWPAPLVEEWAALLRHVSLNRYPDPAATELQARLRATMAVPAGVDLLLGNGSDEILQLMMMAVAGPGRKILVPAPTFSMYHMIAKFVGLECVAVPLNGSDFTLDMTALRLAIDAYQPAVIFLAYPNNPTGNLFADADVLELIKTAPGLVVVDEAYHAFAAGKSFLSAVPEHENLVVLRTLSKMGLAGLRVGFALGAPAWLNELNKLRLPYNINVLSQSSAEFALRHYDLLMAQAQDICRDRTWLQQQLAHVRGMTVYPSDANFILFRTPAGRADGIFARLKERNVLIKNLNGSHAQLSDCLRVTVGTPEENRAFLDALLSVI